MTRRQLIQSMCVLFISMALMVAGSIMYTRYAITKSNHAWCETINMLNTRYEKLPPNADADAKLLARQMKVLKERYGC